MRAAQLTGPIKVSGVVAIRALFGYSGFTQQKRVGKAIPGMVPGAASLKHTNQRQHLGYRIGIHFVIERLKCGTAGFWRPERSELAALSAVATTDLCVPSMGTL